MCSQPVVGGLIYADPQTRMLQWILPQLEKADENQLIPQYLEHDLPV
jgi:hypothetical protein